MDKKTLQRNYFGIGIQVVRTVVILEKFIKENIEGICL